jgi:Flp pilus assembly protein TadB
MTDIKRKEEPAVYDRELERQGRGLVRPGIRFFVLSIICAIPGVVLVVWGHSLVMAIGIVILALAGGPAVIGTGLLLSGAVARWSARHRSFA